MAKVSVSEAARLAGISRTNFYKSYVKTGKLTVERDEDGKPTVDTSEILRVFGRLQDISNDTEQNEQKVTPENTPNLSSLEAELKAVRELLSIKDEQLSDAKEREAWMRKQIEELTTAVRLIEDKREQQPPKKKRWWPF